MLAADSDVLAGTAARRAGVEIRELGTAAATVEAAELFGTIWGSPDEPTPVSANTMRALCSTGNYGAGAYAGATMVGAALAWFTDETPAALHSHICGVAGAMSGRGVGFAIKLHQRAWALRRGIGMITWTVDPLIRTNIYFNLAKLGASVTDYLPDFYGPMTDGVNAGDTSDRLLLSWPLTADRVTAAGAGVPFVITRLDGARTVLAVGTGGEPVLADASAAPVVRCELPADIVGLRRSNPPLATAWRHAVRTTLTTALRSGYNVAGVDRTGCYVLTR